jgi:hypothetical protein
MKALALALLLIGVGAQANAQRAPTPIEARPPPSDAELSELLANPRTNADQAYEVGVRLFEAKRYEAAERAWLRAHSLGGDPTFLVAVADLRQRRGDGPGAVAMLRQYLVERPDAPDRSSIEARIATLLQSPAVLVIRSEEPGYAVLLDGAPVGKKTPTEIEVKPGLHTVVVFGDGRRVGEMTVQVGHGEVKELEFTSEDQSDVLIEQAEEARLAAQLAIEKEDRTIRRAVIATGGLSGAALVSGTVLGFLALQQEQIYRDDPSKKVADKGERLALFADLSFGLAALSAITSFTLFMTHKNKRKRERETGRLSMETRGNGSGATIRF